MSKSRKLRSVPGTIALVFAVLSFIFGSAPFTPAMALVFIAVPLAVVSALLGAWRLGLLAIYFSAAAWFSVPISKGLLFRIDYLLVLMAVLGSVIGVTLLAGYRRNASST